MDDRQNDISLRALQIFLAVDHARSIAHAAELLNSSPSSISQHITGLEKSLQTRLFDRTTRPIAITPSGLMLKKHARKIIDTLGQLHHQIGDLSLEKLPRLTLALVDDLDATLNPALVANLRQRNPQCKINVTSGQSHIMMEQLAKRHVDLVIGAVPPADVETFEHHEILTEAFVGATAKAHANLGGMAVTDLEKVPLIRYGETSPIGVRIDQQLQRCRVRIQSGLSFVSSRSIFATLLQDECWAITTPLSLLDSEPFLSELHVFELPMPRFFRQLYLISRRHELGDLPSQLAQFASHHVETVLCRQLERFFSLPPLVLRATSH